MNRTINSRIFTIEQFSEQEFIEQGEFQFVMQKIQLNKDDGLIA